MNIRTTEVKHSFTHRIFKEMQISNLQGLTCNINNQITAGIEVVDFEPEEILKLDEIFSLNDYKNKIYVYKFSWDSIISCY